MDITARAAQLDRFGALWHLRSRTRSTHTLCGLRITYHWVKHWNWLATNSTERCPRCRFDYERETS